jgi:hypothetical protein
MFKIHYVLDHTLVDFRFFTGPCPRRITPAKESLSAECEKGISQCSPFFWKDFTDSISLLVLCTWWVSLGGASTTFPKLQNG